MRLEQEHLIPRSRGGSDRITNLTIACRPCNERKGNQTAAEFGFPHLMAQAQSTAEGCGSRQQRALGALSHPRSRRDCPSRSGRAADEMESRPAAAGPRPIGAMRHCVGASTPDDLRVAVASVLLIAATGHGRRQMCRNEHQRLPDPSRRRQKRWFGFRSGDLVRAVIPSGKYAGRHVGRITVRSRPSFRLNGFDVHPKYLTLVQRADGYAYTLRKEARHSSAV